MVRELLIKIMSIFKTNKKELFFTPFGPTMGYIQMPESLVKYLNKSIQKKLQDNSKNLVGKVSEELKFDNEIVQIVFDALKNFIYKYVDFTVQRNSFGEKKLDQNNTFNISIVDGWFVRQFENEYNPIHIHSGSQMSCVGYLSLPNGLEEEWEEDYKDHFPSNGHIQFTSGESATIYSQNTFLIKPTVGDFYIFPSNLWHCVYPFYTNGERRSFSMNINFMKT